MCEHTAPRDPPLLCRVALRASQGHFVPMFRMTAGGCFAVCVSKDTHKTKTLTCHPERTKYAKLFAVERSEQQKVEPLAAKRSINAYNSFPRANELFRVHKRHRKTRVCANILRREIRLMLRISRPTGFVRSLCSRTQDDREGMFCGKH